MCFKLVGGTASGMSSNFLFTDLSFRRTAMTTLMINDLPDVEVLDRVAMSAITGGMIDQRLADYIQNVYQYTHDYAGGARPVPKF
jgi:hypothetical protein